MFEMESCEIGGELLVEKTLWKGLSLTGYAIAYQQWDLEWAS